jgi:hypothetical protein
VRQVWLGHTESCLSNEVFDALHLSEQLLARDSHSLQRFFTSKLLFRIHIRCLKVSVVSDGLVLAWYVAAGQ